MVEHRLEVELKYMADAAARDAMVAAESLGVARLGPVVLNDETDVYLDTAGGYLARRAWACRLRTRRVASAESTSISLKGPAAAIVGAVHRRPEVEGPAGPGMDPAGWPPSPARDLLDELRGGEPLTELLTLHQARRERAVLDPGGARVGTMSVDAVLVIHRGRRVGRLGMVELELAADRDPSELVALEAVLARLDGLIPDGHSKLEHALAMARGLPGVRS